MKIVHYTSDNPWTGYLMCPSCGHGNPAWQSSGMSDSRPHFYCSLCSNVLSRDSDNALLRRYGATLDLLDRLSSTLPECPCGGRFSVEAHLKCRKCRGDMPNNDSPVERLDNPHLLILDGSTLVRDTLYDYEVCIGSRVKYWYRRACRALRTWSATR